MRKLLQGERDGGRERQLAESEKKREVELQEEKKKQQPKTKQNKKSERHFLIWNATTCIFSHIKKSSCSTWGSPPRGKEGRKGVKVFWFRVLCCYQLCSADVSSVIWLSLICFAHEGVGSLVFNCSEFLLFLLSPTGSALHCYHQL